MSCRATGCEQREWMARKFCDRHWKMLPLELQLRIRKMLERRRADKATPEELQPLFAEAHKIIEAKETDLSIAVQINLFRTHMASVAGVVAALRTIPLKDLHEQLHRSQQAQIATDPEGHAEVAQRVAMDLELLEILVEMGDKLGVVIRKYAPPEPAEIAE